MKKRNIYGVSRVGTLFRVSFTGRAIRCHIVVPSGQVLAKFYPEKICSELWAFHCYRSRKEKKNATKEKTQPFLMVISFTSI